MDLIVNSETFARIGDVKVSLRRRLAAYDLVFGMAVQIRPSQETKWIVDVHGATVTAHASSGRSELVGKATPEQLLRLRPLDISHPAHHALILPLQPGEMVALEGLRGGGELRFELNFHGRARSMDGGVLDEVDHVYGSMTVSCPQSHWVEQLRNANVREILLFEVWLPVAEHGTKWGNISSRLKKALARLEGGDSEACISGCREVFDQLRDFDTYSKALSRLSTDHRKTMDSLERHIAIEATVRHMTHLAHHGSDEAARAMSLTHADARTAVIITAALAQRVYELEMQPKADAQQQD